MGKVKIISSKDGNCKQKLSRDCQGIKKLVISCFYDVGTQPNPNPNIDSTQSYPVGFNWANVMSTEFKDDYRVTILLHGENIRYGLNNKAYTAKYGTPNPYRSFLNKLHTQGVKAVICHLCLTQDGYNDSDLISYVRPVKFSVDYIAKSVTKGKIVVYDAQLSYYG